MIELPHRDKDVPPMDALGGGNGMDIPSMPSNPPMPQDNPMPNDDMGDNASGDDFDGMDDSSDDGINPKKSVQQLTGKLSQELRNYNNDQEQPDEDLNKYVAGMIIPQATKAMTDKGKKEVINKIKKGITDDEIDDSSDEMGDNEQENNDMQMESKLYEIINNILDNGCVTKKTTQKITNKTLPKRSPFRSNR